jgi:hypothetical protein
MGEGFNKLELELFVKIGELETQNAKMKNCANCRFLEEDKNDWDFHFKCPQRPKHLMPIVFMQLSDFAPCEHWEMRGR